MPCRPTHLMTCFQGILSRSCLYNLSTLVAKCIGCVQTSSRGHLNQINCSLTTISYSLNNKNINRNVGSSHLCFYTCMTTIGKSENVLESSRRFRERTT